MIGIDRLVLDLPGMSRDRAARLAEEIGGLLAAAGDRLTATERLEIVLPSAPASDDAILAAIAASLRARAV